MGQFVSKHLTVQNLLILRILKLWFMTWVYAIVMRKMPNYRQNKYQNQWYADYSVKGRKTSATVVNMGCLPFTWSNRSVYGLDKWLTKFRNGKIAFTILVYKSAPSTEKRLRTPRTGIKDGVEQGSCYPLKSLKALELNFMISRAHEEPLKRRINAESGWK